MQMLQQMVRKQKPYILGGHAFHMPSQVKLGADVRDFLSVFFPEKKKVTSNKS